MLYCVMLSDEIVVFSSTVVSKGHCSSPAPQLHKNLCFMDKSITWSHTCGMNRQHKEALSVFSPQGLCTTQENPIRATGSFSIS